MDTNNKAKEYYSNWYLKNKEQQLAKMSEKTNCDVCNKEITKNKMYSHIKTKLHLTNLERYNEVNNLKSALATKVNEINEINKIINK